MKFANQKKKKKFIVWTEHRPGQPDPKGLGRVEWMLGSVRVQYSGLPWVRVGFGSDPTRPIF